MEPETIFDVEISIGPFGGDSGEPYSYRAPNAITQIIVVHSDQAVESVVFKGDGNADYSPKLGAGYIRKTKTDRIEVNFPLDYITGVSGRVGHQDSWLVLKSIKFYTRVTEYGPFGKEDGTPFSFRPSGALITGFHGRSGVLVDAIGFFAKPLSAVYSIVPKTKDSEPLAMELYDVSPGPWGGNGGRGFDDGVFSGVKQIHVHVCCNTASLSGIQFEYVKKDGSRIWSGKHGSGGGQVVKKIVMEDGEYIHWIEGFYGPTDGMSVVRSITFVTNLGRYGPLGNEMGTFFKSVKKGKIVGFFGRCREYVDAIGVHSEY